MLKLPRRGSRLRARDVSFPLSILVPLQKAFPMSKTIWKLVILLSAAFALASFVSSVSATEREVVAFRLIEWKTVHFDDAQRAGSYADAIERLGCEVRTSDHGGHIDVSFRCPLWREIAVDSHAKAHEWENWLKSKGFETHHAYRYLAPPPRSD